MQAGSITNTYDTDAVIGRGYTDRVMSGDEAKSILQQVFTRWYLNGQRVLVLLPDGARTAPIPLLFEAICQQLYTWVARLDFMIALVAHCMMSDGALERHPHDGELAHQQPGDPVNPPYLGAVLCLR